jgi:ferredoxin
MGFTITTKYKKYITFRGTNMTWTINNNKCLRCGGCVSVCPTAALELRDNILHDQKLCTNCGICEKACPVEAIKVTKP